MPVPLARLTNAAFANTMHDLFPKLNVTLPPLPDEITSTGFRNDSAAQSPSSLFVEQLQASAEALGDAAAADPSAVLPCTIKSPADEVACGSAFLDSLARRAFRRPPSVDERARLQALFDGTRMAKGFAEAVNVVVQAIVQSPQVLYLEEKGDGVCHPGADPTTDEVKLSAYELASRLSYFLWQTTPDETLLTDAAEGRLATPEGIDLVVRRMMHDVRARAAMADFHAQWLGLDRVAGKVKDTTAYPGFNAAIARRMAASTATFVDDVFWQRGTLEALLTSPDGWVDDSLAPFFGVAPPGVAATDGSKLVRVKLDATRRAGILTQPGILAGLAHESSDAPVLRGLYVLNNLLCAPSPPPPAGVNTSLPAVVPGDVRTTRQRLEQSHEVGVCAGCHKRIDGVGFGFSHFDAVGAFRDTEQGLTVDATGLLTGVGDADGTFDGAVALATKLVGAHQVKLCVSQKLTRYALGLDNAGLPLPHVESLAQTLETNGGDLRELVVSLTKSDAFRCRPRPAAQP